MSKWISVKDRLPDHNEIVLALNKKNLYAVVVFVDSIQMNESLRENGYGSEAVDVKKNPYYFCSQETARHTLNEVTHWMPLPNAPKNI